MGMKEYMRMKELHSAGCTIYDSTALCGGCNCVVRGCTSSSVGLVTSQQPGPAFQNLHTETPHTLTLSYIYTDNWAVQCGDLLLYNFTRINSVIFTLTA